jgi:hypothetical protein
MQFYSYLTETPFSEGMKDAPLGTSGQFIDRDLKTVRGVANRIRRAFPNRSFKVYTFTNFYDDKTFRIVYRHLA